MGVFHVFEIAQMVPNLAMHHKYEKVLYILKKANLTAEKNARSTISSHFTQRKCLSLMI